MKSQTNSIADILLQHAILGICYSKAAEKIGISRQYAHQILIKENKLDLYHTLRKRPIRCRECKRLLPAKSFTKIKGSGRMLSNIKGCTCRFCVEKLRMRVKELMQMDAPDYDEMLDETISWAAGIYEGEGSVGRSLNVAIFQKDSWILDKLKKLFGGRIAWEPLRGKEGLFCWYVHQPESLAFLTKVFKYLSPRRKNQIREKITNSTLQLNVEVHGAAA